MSKSKIALTINGAAVEAEVEPRTLLIHFLREDLSITGPHIGCETSHCGACTVDLNGRSVKACTVFAVQAAGGELLTVEGLANGAELHPLQQSFADSHGLQCGYCTPGMLTRAYRLLQENPNPDRRGNPRRHFRKPVPLYGIPEHRQGDSIRRGHAESGRGS